jgi:S1-C subfamily serine protease
MFRVRVLLAWCVFFAAAAQATPPPKFTPDVAFASTTIVWSGTGAAAGTVIDRPERLLLTSWHGTAQEGPIQVFFPMYEEGKLQRRGDIFGLDKEGKGVRAEIVLSAPDRDLCVLRVASVPETSPGLQLAETSAAENEVVLLSGQPFQQAGPWQDARGKVDHVGPEACSPRAGQYAECRSMVVKLDQPIAVGYSGGPAVNQQNQLVGITVWGSEAMTTGYCVDVSEVKVLLIEAYLRLALQYRCAGDVEHAIACRDRALALAGEAPNYPVDALIGFAQRGWSSTLGQLADAPRRLLGAWSKK